MALALGGACTGARERVCQMGSRGCVRVSSVWPDAGVCSCEIQVRVI